MDKNLVISNLIRKLISLRVQSYIFIHFQKYLTILVKKLHFIKKNTN